MRNIAEFTLIGRVGTIKQVGKTVRVSICANYPFKDDKGQWKDDAHWNEVTIFTKAIQSYVSEHVSKGDLVHVRGRLRQNSFERDGQRVYTVDLSLWSSAGWRRPANAPRHSEQRRRLRPPHRFRPGASATESSFRHSYEGSFRDRVCRASPRSARFFLPIAETSSS